MPPGRSTVVPSSEDVGGLVGRNPGLISDSYATGQVNGGTSSSNTGGLVGQNNGMISKSYATGAVSGRYWVGGLVGYNNSGGTISDCYAVGHVNGDSRVGGLLGVNSSGGTISDCYAVGGVMGTVNVGGLVGENGGTVNDSFWDTESSGQATSAGGTGKTTVQMKQQATFSGWNFSDPWGIFENQTPPLLQAILLCIQDGTGYPLGDHNGDCLVTMLDFAFSVQFWFEDRNWAP